MLSEQQLDCFRHGWTCANEFALYPIVDVLFPADLEICRDCGEPIPTTWKWEGVHFGSCHHCVVTYRLGEEGG